jgi:tetratricopeptide (TPR) repeat protein
VGAALALTLVALAGLTAAGVALVGGDSGGGASHKKEAKARQDAGRAAAGAGSAVVSDGASAAAPEPAAVEDEASAPSSSVEGASLNAEGFSLINQGRAPEAVPILQRAVDSYPEGTTDLTYAYALYNLGNALRLSGHPEEAIPVLERRLRIPNQRSTVAAELARARAEAGTG